MSLRLAPLVTWTWVLASVVIVAAVPASRPLAPIIDLLRQVAVAAGCDLSRPDARTRTSRREPGVTVRVDKGIAEIEVTCDTTDPEEFPQ